ncbi:MFS transporter [Ehrlichia ruminantium]|uniref:Bicyclomycin resistance protein n=1 Tax=Ehrlichia ruminantium (strain Welgevonden) TaxID=254945 RepID=A0A0H3M1W9_EHRRW|nr:MFS transporter [Ehrlichia ruminantium]CAH58477.1 putative integral membrane protein [Ehrlichia ruminantium str. Welgevonden]QLK56344.1 MFS transporter [Ehrlichia ruminantium]QLK58170.1 MFS transporter [Ehrlichia ruminantium]UOD97736.1 MFS transporter [Ehrlichia ruminantium]
MEVILSRKFFIWSLVSLFYAYQYVLRVMPNAISSICIVKFNISNIAFGQFLGLYYIGYTLAHIPIGFFLDKYGPKVILSVCAVLTVAGLIPLIISDVWLFVQIGRIVSGIGSAGAALGIFKIASMYYNEKFAKMVGFSIIIGLLGAMYGGLPVLSLLDKFGWEHLFIGFIGIGLVLALLLYIFILPYNSSSNESGDVCKKLKLVLLNKYTIIISLLAGFMIGPLEGFADGWASSFLRTISNISQESAALLPSMIFFGVCFGAFGLPYMLEKSFDGYNLLILSAVAMLGAFVLMFIASSSVVLVLISFFILGFFSAYQIIATDEILRHVDSNVVALTSAVNNMIVMGFGYVFHTAISYVLDLSWDGKIVDSVPVYDKTLMLNAMLCIPCGLLIGLVGFTYLKYKNKKYVN